MLPYYMSSLASQILIDLSCFFFFFFAASIIFPTNTDMYSYHITFGEKPEAQNPLIYSVRFTAVDAHFCSILSNSLCYGSNIAEI